MLQPGAELQVDKPYPRIKINEGIVSPECPYNVEVNSDGVINLLQSSGVSEEKLRKIKVEVTRKPDTRDLGVQTVSVLHKLWGGELGGSYNHLNNSLKIYTDTFWPQKDFDKANAILDKREQNQGEVLSRRAKKNLFPNMKSGKRLSWYLSVVPPERGRETVRRLLSQKANIEVNKALNHEIEHATEQLDVKDLLKSLGVYATTVMGLDGFYKAESLLTGKGESGLELPLAILLAIPIGNIITYWFFSSAEKHARAAEEDVNPERLITITSK